jgi:hypothetical protein
MAAMTKAASDTATAGHWGEFTGLARLTGGFLGVGSGSADAKEYQIICSC